MTRLAAALAVDGAGFATPDGQWLAFGGAAILPVLPALGEGVRCFDVGKSTVFAAPIMSYGDAADRWLVVWLTRKPLATKAAQLLFKLDALTAQMSLARVRAGSMEYRHRLRRAAKTAAIGFWSCELPGEQIEWSEGVYELFELPAGSAVPRQLILEMYAPDSRSAMEAVRRQAIETGGSMRFDAKIKTATGKKRWIRITGTVDVEDGKATRIFGIKQDITEEKVLAQETRRLANTDPMTGLANRMHFQTRLEEPVGALLLLDLDGFKGINDTLGHAAGDACLIETAQRMAECCGPDTLMARIGGDEFAVVLDDERPDVARLLAQTIVARLQEPYRFNGTTRKVTASVGIAYGHVCVADELYARADQALYAAKREGRNTWREFTPA
ncbi:diguanylate cyclase [Devosia sp. Leaf64]|uniref:diguanylate cyclase domain-containing protein n=1 Tax=Devosia sp. Leaf64 TaxID=1736229 RepID=UPI0007127D56|nr:diguanylate cyclase [Devosia sp. Leaf64]KQN72593.1 hypothetical protein ASE94_08825 [Devosia sp. Leaf64]